MQHLKRSSRVALVAPSFNFDKLLFKRGVSFLENVYGLTPIYSKDIFSKNLYFAGNNKRRLNELSNYFLDPSIEAIFTIRGGFGVSKIYQDLIKILRKNNPKPKMVFGYSDLTILLNGLYQDLGWKTAFHGPVLVGKAFHEPSLFEKNSMARCLFSSKPLGKISKLSMKSLNNGQAHGPIVGGNLSLMASSIGTSYEIQTSKKILFIEDVTESPYRIDRMLTQLLHAGKFNKVKGLIFGQFEKCGTITQVNQSILSALSSIIKEKNIPTIIGFPAGHSRPQLTFPIGATVDVLATHQGCEVTFN